MGILVAIASLAVIAIIMVDAFETTVQPRRVTHGYRFARLFYRTTWKGWCALSTRFPAGKSREACLSLFGPLSLLGLLSTWVFGLILAFALLYWSLDIELRAPEQNTNLGSYLYLSGVTFFTLGYGDVTPTGGPGRTLAVAEAGIGFGFLAIIIAYLPVIYQAFSRREVLINLLDARAGSPPSALQHLIRVAQSGNVAAIDPFLAEWERWSAELLESHLSYPALVFYRSQHENQSWLGALTVILDTCAFLIVGVKGYQPYQAQLTFAMARHTAVDLALVFKTPPVAPDSDRLPPELLQQMRRSLRDAGLNLQESAAVDEKLAELRGMYEPFVNALARFCRLQLPPFATPGPSVDNWQRSAWLKRAPEFGSLPMSSATDAHFG
jgi:hypothetical protein